MAVEHRVSWESPGGWFCAEVEARHGRGVWRTVDWDTFIPEDQWHRTEVVFTHDRWDQVNNLRAWAKSHEQPIRNVVLERREIPDPASGWEVVGQATPPAERSGDDRPTA